MRDFGELDKKCKKSQESCYNKRHRVKDLPVLPDQLPVWVETQGTQTPGQIQHRADTPSSYIVDTPTKPMPPSSKIRAHSRSIRNNRTKCLEGSLLVRDQVQRFVHLTDGLNRLERGDVVYKELWLCVCMYYVSRRMLSS